MIEDIAFCPVTTEDGSLKGPQKKGAGMFSR